MMGQPIRKTPIEEILYRLRTGPPRRLESEGPLWMRPGRDALAASYYPDSPKCHCDTNVAEVAATSTEPLHPLITDAD